LGQHSLDATCTRGGRRPRALPSRCPACGAPYPRAGRAKEADTEAATTVPGGVAAQPCPRPNGRGRHHGTERNMSELVCGACVGKGYVIGWDGAQESMSLGGFYPREVMEPCEDCGGTGLACCTRCGG